jgi:hypothetical protein
MPNWTVNRITFKGNPERISELKNHILSIDNDGDLQFDFNRVIPMPEELNGTHAPSLFYDKNPSPLVGQLHPERKLPQDMTDEELLSKNPHSFKTLEEVREGRLKSQQLIEKYGFDNWYDWCIENWSVKWNACETHVYNNDEPNIFTFRFETPWNEPQNVFSKLHDQYSDLEIEICFTHEGGFGGQYITWNPVDKIFTVQDLQETTVYEDKDGSVIECVYDEETDEYLDKDGNVIHDYYTDWSPSDEKIIVPLEQAVW